MIFIEFKLNSFTNQDLKLDSSLEYDFSDIYINNSFDLLCLNFRRILRCGNGDLTLWINPFKKSFKTLKKKTIVKANVYFMCKVFIITCIWWQGSAYTWDYKFWGLNRARDRVHKKLYGSHQESRMNEVDGSACKIHFMPIMNYNLLFYIYCLFWS